MPFELDDLRMSDGDLVAFAATGLAFYLGMRVYLWLRIFYRTRHRNSQRAMALHPCADESPDDE